MCATETSRARGHQEGSGGGWHGQRAGQGGRGGKSSGIQTVQGLLAPEGFSSGGGSHGGGINR